MKRLPTLFILMFVCAAMAACAFGVNPKAMLRNEPNKQYETELRITEVSACIMKNTMSRFDRQIQKQGRGRYTIILRDSEGTESATVILKVYEYDGKTKIDAYVTPWMIYPRPTTFVDDILLECLDPYRYDIRS